MIRSIAVSTVVSLLLGCASYEKETVILSQESIQNPAPLEKTVFPTPDGRLYVMFKSMDRFGGGAFALKQVGFTDISGVDFGSGGGLIGNSREGETSLKVGYDVIQYSDALIEGQPVRVFRVNKKISITSLE